MKRKIKVSIIVPVYNVEKYLSKCLDSLVNQSLNDIEIIVVNDGSTDHSQTIIDQYVKEYKGKVFSYVKENGGLSSARNLGIQKANGEFIAFVDSDDYVDLDMFEKMYLKAIKTKSEIVVCGITFQYENKALLNYIFHEDIYGCSLKDQPDIMLYSNSYACNKIFQRKMWLDNHFIFPNQVYEDSALIYNVLYSAHKIEVVNIPFYQYNRVNENSIVNTINEKIFDIFKSCDSLLNFYRDKGDDLYQNACNLCLCHVAVRISHFKRSKDYKLIHKFMRYAASYFDKNIPLWRDEKYIKELLHQPSYLATNLNYLKHYYRYRLSQVKSFAKFFSQPDKKEENQDKSAEEITLLSDTKTMDSAILQTIFDLCHSHGWDSFCTLRTLLEVVQKNTITSKRMSVGILADTNAATTLRYELIAAGFVLDREYLFNDIIYQQDFKYQNLSITLKYYEVENKKMFSYQFYREKGSVYPPYQMNVLRMGCPLATSFKKVFINSVEVFIPSNYSSILKQIYGKNLDDFNLTQHKANNTNEKLGHVRRIYCNYEEVLTDQMLDKNAVNLLNQLHEIELVILKEIMRICKEYKITYYMGEGSLLGAIRHQGFIPWDDDIDVIMPRKDYELFLKIAPQVISKKFEIQHSTTIDNYWSPFIKVRYLDNSFYRQKHIAHLTDHNGPLIDIFPLDNVPKKDSFGQKIQALTIKLNRGMLSYKLKIRIPKKWKGYIVKFLSNFVSVKHIHKVLAKTFIKYNCSDNPYIVNLGSYYSYDKQTHPKEWYGKPRMVKFENLTVPVPCEAEKILTCIYGDYMKLPPRSKRVIKHHFER